MATKSDLVELAQDKLKEVIKILKVACKGDENAKVYIIDYLKIMTTSGHGFCTNDISLDTLIERYEDDIDDVGGDEFFEDD